MKYIKVTDNFIKKSLEMAEDLYGYADCFGGDKENKKRLKYHIKMANKYLKGTE